MHRGVIAKVHELWPPREAALIDAMVIGEEAFIDRDTRVDFQRSGTYHVLVVSGMNVSILAFVVFWTLRRLRLGEIPATVLTVTCCIAYAFITEVGAPVWRATLMCAVYLATRLLYRDRAMVNAIGAAALGLLVFDPRQLFTASFQMTFVCVLIVAAIGIPVLERTSQLYKRALANWESPDYAALLPPRVAQFRVDLQFIAARLALFVGEKWSRTVGPRDDRFRPFCLGIALHLSGDADGTGAAHGVLLSSRHYDGIAREPDRRTANAVDDARGRHRACAGIHFAVAGQDSGASNHVRNRWNRRQRARAGRDPPRRSARRHAIDR